MQKSKFQTLVFSAVGVGLVFFAIVGANLVFSPIRARMDLTKDRLHTLSDGTRRILDKIDSPIEVRLYASRGDNRMPSGLKNYVQNVEDLLSEFRAQARGRLDIKKFDPEPDSDAEDAAKSDGVEPQMLNTGEGFYLGLAVSLEPNKATLPFLSPQREKLLEYDLARAISQVLSTNKPVVGIMTPLPVMGQPANPMMMRMGQQQGSEPWVAISELKRDFQVETVGMEVEKIDEKIKVLVVIHPKDISEKAQYAVDQFVLRGGKLIAFLDSMCLVDNRQPNQFGLNMSGGSSLPKLLKAWGLDFDTSKVVADLNYMKPIQGRGGQQQLVPTLLFVNSEGINKDDAVTSQSDNVWLPFSGAITGKASDGLKMDTLLHSTDNSQLVDGMTSQVNGQKIVDEFRASNVKYALGVRLSGKFKTGFPDGPPGSDKKDSDKKDEKPASSDGLKESKTDGIVYLFGDADLLADRFSVQVDPFFRMAQPINGNLAMVQGLVEQAAGDANLVGARSRASLSRPFTVVQKIETEARGRWQKELERLQKQQEEAQTKLNEIQVKKEGNTSRVILTPEQKAAIENFQKQQIEAKKQLKAVRKSLRQDVDSLENKLKWTNIALVPLLVTFTGVGLAWARRNRQGAR